MYPKRYMVDIKCRVNADVITHSDLLEYFSVIYFLIWRNRFYSIFIGGFFYIEVNAIDYIFYFNLLRDILLCYVSLYSATHAYLNHVQIDIYKFLCTVSKVLFKNLEKKNNCFYAYI